MVVAVSEPQDAANHSSPDQRSLPLHEIDLMSVQTPNELGSPRTPKEANDTILQVHASTNIYRRERYDLPAQHSQPARRGHGQAVRGAVHASDGDDEPLAHMHAALPGQ
jgi:hypothetical protein